MYVKIESLSLKIYTTTSILHFTEILSPTPITANKILLKAVEGILNSSVLLRFLLSKITQFSSPTGLNVLLKSISSLVFFRSRRLQWTQGMHSTLFSTPLHTNSWNVSSSSPVPGYHTSKFVFWCLLVHFSIKISVGRNSRSWFDWKYKIVVQGKGVKNRNFMKCITDIIT